MRMKQVILMPEAVLVLTKAEIEHLIKCSLAHYDGHCKSISERGGFLYGWKNAMTFGGGDTIEVLATSRQLDTLCKVTEIFVPDQGIDPDLAWALRRAHRALTKHYQTVNVDEPLYMRDGKPLIDPPNPL